MNNPPHQSANDSNSAATDISHRVVHLANGFRFQWEPAQNSHVLLYPEGMKVLSESAAAIVEFIDGERTVEQIVAALEAKFPGTELRQDVLDFITDAKTQGWMNV